MVDYLYYKLYKVALKSSLKEIPQILTVSWLGALLGLNILMLNALLAKTLSVHWFFKNHRTAGWFALILIIMLLLYFSKERRLRIIERFSNENNSKRVKGNIAVIFYIALSLISTIIVAFYRPGKL